MIWYIAFRFPEIVQYERQPEQSQFHGDIHQSYTDVIAIFRFTSKSSSGKSRFTEIDFVRVVFRTVLFEIVGWSRIIAHYVMHNQFFDRR